ncbi:MAG: hypothetical protein K2X90_02635 [Candidatus Babeliaceae bacterium]|nr:hypothetical protein [Candidatus Babeliaceae bacterium]
MNSVLRSSYKTIIISASYSFVKVLTLSKIIGYRLSFFSMSQLVTPILALHITSTELIGLTTLRTLFHLLMYPASGILGVLYHLPTLVGALYFKASFDDTSKIARIVAPLVCMALFVSTSVGSQAWAYSFFWLTPFLISLIPHRSLFLSSLASTFMAHAVGSVLFIVSTPMIPAFWLGLIPLVAFERSMFAAGITALYYAMKVIQQLFRILSVRFAHA